MSVYDEGIKLLNDMFGNGKYNVISLATIALEATGSGKPRPVVRSVDACYENGTFYVVTSASSNKMRQIAQNPEVSVSGCLEMFTANGIGENLGWVLDAKMRNSGLSFVLPSPHGMTMQTTKQTRTAVFWLYILQGERSISTIGKSCTTWILSTVPKWRTAVFFSSMSYLCGVSATKRKACTHAFSLHRQKAKQEFYNDNHQGILIRAYFSCSGYCFRKLS